MTLFEMIEYLFTNMLWHSKSPLTVYLRVSPTVGLHRPPRGVFQVQRHRTCPRGHPEMPTDKGKLPAPLSAGVHGHGHTAQGSFLACVATRRAFRPAFLDRHAHFVQAVADLTSQGII